ncbi:magnesium transporter [Guyparkeria halopsychrophila]|uniref:magnesium transporter n=1 Tax=Guyparkeria halopsychrophila TaxID=3139421 RepID=UPI0037C73F3E
MPQSEKIQQLAEAFWRFEHGEVDAGSLCDDLAAVRDQDIARAMAELDRDGMGRVLDLLPAERRAEVFGFLEPRTQFALTERLDDETARELIEGLRPDNLTALLEDLSPEEGEAVVRRLSPERVGQAMRLLGYPPESAGRLMTPDFIALRPDWTLSHALAHVQGHSGRSETVDVLFITDGHGRLLGWAGLRTLVLGDPQAKVESLLGDEPVSIVVSEDREEAARLIQHYDLTALPVVDDAGVLLGMVTIDDVMDVVEEEATEDIHKLGGLGAKHLSLRGASILELFKKRIGWLLLLVFVAIFAAGAVSQFEETLEAAVVLTFFLPLIIGSGGNAGSQGATMMVRALATGDVGPKDWLKLWVRELGVASALGVTMGAAAWGIGLFYGGTMLANVVLLSMIAVVIFGSMVGMLLPFLLTRFRLDPATASAPLITSIADIGGILIYFGIATAWIEAAPVG